MSWFALLAIAVTLTIIMSQFGKRLAARNSLVWWSVGVFIIIVSSFPDTLKPLIQALGIQLVSNFVLAGLIMFLFLQVLELTAESTQSSRTLRKLVSNLAADSFIQKNPDLTRPGRDHARTRVLIALPTYNEQDAVARTFRELKNGLERDGSSYEYIICFINDGSSDSTRENLQRICPENFTSHQVNVGVSGGIMTGFAIAQQIGAEFVVQFDADGQHPADRIANLIEYAEKNKLDLVVGSRFVKSGEFTQAESTKSTTRSRILGILVIRRMLDLFGSKARIKDPTSGFRVYSRKAQQELLKHMPDEYPEPESIAILAMSGARMGEVLVEMEARATGVSSISGLKTLRFMVKVITALFGLRLRTLLTQNL